MRKMIRRWRRIMRNRRARNLMLKGKSKYLEDEECEEDGEEEKEE